MNEDSQSFDIMGALKSPMHSSTNSVSMCQKCSSIENEDSVKRKRKSRLKDDAGSRIVDFSRPRCYPTIHDVLPRLSRLLHTQVFFVIMCISLLPLTTAQLSWNTAPSDTSVLLDGNAVIICRVNNLILDTHKVEWRQYMDNGSDHTFFVDDLRLAAPFRFGAVNNGLGYSLEVDGAVREDDSEFQCGVPAWDAKRVRLTVQVEAGQPQILTNKSLSSLQENDFIEFRCSSTGGNPPPTFEWFRDTEMLQETAYLQPGVKFGTTESLLVRELTRDDDNTQLRCEARNEANNQAVVTSIGLTVKYAPVIDLGPHDPFKVIMSERVELNCVSDANPDVLSADVHWRKNPSPGIIYTGFDLVFDNIEMADAAEYSCEATNEVGLRSRTVMLDVLYGPSVTLQYSNGDIQGNEVRINEFQPINVSCIVSSNPVATNDKIRWLKGGILIHTGPYYYIPSVSREQMGSYECEAWNTLEPSGGQPQNRSDTAYFVLQVLYPPGRATITVPPLVIKGESATMNCSMDDPGNPPGDLEWSKLGESSLVATGPTVEFNPVLLSDHGEYICKPKNTVGDGQIYMEVLDVNERPEWLGSEIPDVKNVMINETSLEVVCQVRGKPVPLISWFKDGATIESNNPMFKIHEIQQLVDKHSWNVTSVLKWEGPGRDPPTGLGITDAANYTCHGRNDLDQVEKKMVVNVLYSPVIEAISEKVAIDRNQSATMSCVSHGFPRTAFEWYNSSTKLSTGGRIHIREEEIGSEMPYHSIITISDVSNMDLGEYSCRGCNIMGCNQAAISLTVKDVPDRPTDVRINSKTWETVDIHWTKGFDGGYIQSFDVHMRYYDNKTNSYAEAWHSATEDSNLNVTDLFPSINYTLTVFARNLLGPSDGSQSVSTVTLDFTITPPSRVEYDQKERILFFTSPSSNYCARIEINSGSSWDMYEECAPAEGSVQIGEGFKVQDVRVALCLTRRQNVCSPSENAEFVGEDLPRETIIIVGCVCGGVVVILTIVLVVLCCKRNKSKKNYEKQESGNQMYPVMPPSATSVSDNVPLKPAIKGVDNPGLDQLDHGSSGYPTEPVFTTNSSGKPPGSPHDPYGYDRRPNGYHNGQLQVPNGGHHYDPRHNYDNRRNQELSEKPKLYLDDPYASDSHRESSLHNESGVSTPDPQKPKKVIYEVVV